jgi:hypothetical protein
MLATAIKSLIGSNNKCTQGNAPAAIWINGYTVNADLFLCMFHAQQLARKLLEDICDLAGDRHG